MIKPLLKSLLERLDLYGVKIDRCSRDRHSLRSLSIQDIVDVGANTGQFAQSCFEAGFKGNIYSIEPISSAHGLLAEKANRRRSWHCLPPMAISDIESELQINIYNNSKSSSFFRVDQRHITMQPDNLSLAQTEKVRTVRLDTLISESVIPANEYTMLKVDVQGYEVKTLLSAGKYLDRFGAIKIELSAEAVYVGQPPYIESIQILGVAGFHLWMIQPGYCSLLTGQTFEFDCIFTRSALAYADVKEVIIN